MAESNDAAVEALAKVLRTHLPKDRYDEDGGSVGTYCICGGWAGNYFADGEEGPFDDHLAAAVLASGVVAVRERSCRKHPHWSGMSDDCLFCKREARAVPAHNNLADKVRALHRSSLDARGVVSWNRVTHQSEPYCTECGDWYPCSTVALLGEGAATEGDNR